VNTWGTNIQLKQIKLLSLLQVTSQPLKEQSWMSFKVIYIHTYAGPILVTVTKFTQKNCLQRYLRSQYKVAFWYNFLLQSYNDNFIDCDIWYKQHWIVFKWFLVSRWHLGVEGTIRQEHGGVHQDPGAQQGATDAGAAGQDRPAPRRTQAQDRGVELVLLCDIAEHDEVWEREWLL